MSAEPGHGIVQVANHILTHCAEIAEEDWQAVMARSLPENVYDSNVISIGNKIADQGMTQPVGAIESGTGFISEEAPGEMHVIKEAIRLLKAENRIHQCGRGRGRCIVVLSDLPLEEEEEAVPQDLPKAKPAAVQGTFLGDIKEDSDTKSRTDLVVENETLKHNLEALKGRLGVMETNYKEDVDALYQQLDDKQAEISIRDEEIAQLKNKVQEIERTSRLRSY